MVKTSIWPTCINLYNLNLEMISRILNIIKSILQDIILIALLQSNTLFSTIKNKVVTPTAFRYPITERTRQIIKKIVLPEE